MLYSFNSGFSTTGGVGGIAVNGLFTTLPLSTTKSVAAVNSAAETVIETFESWYPAGAVNSLIT